MVKGESQRTISVSIDVHQPTVNKALNRLMDRGWLTKKGSPRSRHMTYLLHMPGTLEESSTDNTQTAMREELSIENTKTAGTSIDNPMRASVHQLFGAGGLSGAVMDTFACLSEQSRPAGRFRLVRVRPGSQRSDLLTHPYQGVRQIPRPMPGNKGQTARAIATRVRRSPSTIQRHLERLERDGLAFRNGKLWWRLRFDPTAVVEDLGVEDTASRKGKEYLRQRRVYWAGRVDQDGPPTFGRDVDEDGHQIYVDLNTGEVRWTDRQAGTSGRDDGGLRQC